MITHDYSRWREPEKPPFTLEDVVRVVQELMLQYHVSFDEALRHLQERGIPYAAFLDLSGLTEILDRWREEIARHRRAILERYRVDRAASRQEERIRRRTAELEALVRRLRDPRLGEALREASKRRDLARYFRLDWALSRRGDVLSREGREILRELTADVEDMEILEDLLRRPFTGEEEPTAGEARILKERLEALDDLEEQLRKAAQSGDLFSLDAERLRALLGESAAAEFEERREDLRRRFQEALRATGEVDYDEGTDLYKLTPGAARRIGERALRQVFSQLFTDGVGRHATHREGGSGVETERTRPWEPGDSPASLDLPGSLLETLRRRALSGTKAGPLRLDPRDFQVHVSRGAARSALALLIDMSGSMSRFGRFYNAKKLALALDALLRSEFPEDRLFLVGFATFVRRLSMGEVPALAPKPVTLVGGHVNLRVRFGGEGLPGGDRAFLPEHFTNLQKALELARVLLAAEPTRNRHVLLVTDGVPTAYSEGDVLHLTYPPTERTFEAAFREAGRLAAEGIGLTTFMLSSGDEGGAFGEDAFLERLHRVTGGRLLRPAPDRLTQYVLTDYLERKRKIIQI